MKDSAAAAQATKQDRLWPVRFAVFLLILALILAPLSRITALKGVEQVYCSSASSGSGFYSLKRNSLDVLFLGSSHAYCGFYPQELYDQTGIRGYNLGSSQQSVMLSRAWLEEALRFQKPQAVVLEAFYLFYPMGTEASVHKALDYMHLSPVKLRTMLRLAKEDPVTYNPSGFLLPLLRFHERWKELDENDYHYRALMEHAEFKGYSPVGYAYGKSGYMTLDKAPAQDEDPDFAAIDPAVREEFGTIASICRQNGIRLLLVKTPCLPQYWEGGRHRAAQLLADQYGVPFYDLNTNELNTAIGYDYPGDSGDTMHANIKGATKITDWLGGILTESGVRGRTDEQWESTRRFCRFVEAEAKIFQGKPQ